MRQPLITMRQPLITMRQSQGLQSRLVVCNSACWCAAMIDGAAVVGGSNISAIALAILRPVYGPGLIILVPILSDNSYFSMFKNE